MNSTYKKSEIDSEQLETTEQVDRIEDFDTVEYYGTTAQGDRVDAYTLCAGQHRVRILNYGAILLDWLVLTPTGSLQTPFGKAENVVLTLENLSAYERNPAYVGCVVGRYGGRIKDAQIRASVNNDPLTWFLEANDRGNCLHGGHVGFGKRIWQCEQQTQERLVLSYVSPSGEGGFSGELQVKVIYTLSQDGALSVTFTGESQTATVFAPTHHAYFNLSGLENRQKPDVRSHRLQVAAKGLLETDETSVPYRFATDQSLLASFRDAEKEGATAHTVAELSAMTNAAFHSEKGLDYPIELANHVAAVLTAENGKRKLTVTTECPYVVVYAGGWLEASIPLKSWGGSFIQGEKGAVADTDSWGAVPYNGICFETQEMPNGPVLELQGPWWVTPEKPYQRTTWYKISLTE